MKIFQACYDLCLRWAKHRRAPYFLVGLSMAEAVIFPIPPDVMLAPMALASPNKAWRFALLASLGSVIGGVLGYLLGMFAFDSLIHPWIVQMGYQHRLDQAISWFADYGVWVVFLAGFSPIPYKVFTISAGFLQLAIIPFLFASLIGRGMRFFLVAGLMYWGGPGMEQALRNHVEKVGWATVIILIGLYFIFV